MPGVSKRFLELATTSLTSSRRVHGSIAGALADPVAAVLLYEQTQSFWFRAKRGRRRAPAEKCRTNASWCGLARVFLYKWVRMLQLDVLGAANVCSVR